MGEDVVEGSLELLNLGWVLLAEKVGGRSAQLLENCVRVGVDGNFLFSQLLVDLIGDTLFWEKSVMKMVTLQSEAI